MEKFPPEYYHGVLDYMAFQLLKDKRLECCREPLANTMLMADDGTGLHSTVMPVPHSTTKRHGNGELRFYNYVLLLAFLSFCGVVVPSACEFVENGKDYNPEFDKQDCEHKTEIKAFNAFKKNHLLKGIDGPEQAPQPGTSFGTGSIGYHLRSGKHAFLPYDWDHYLNFADWHLKQIDAI